MKNRKYAIVACRASYWSFLGMLIMTVIIAVYVAEQGSDDSIPITYDVATSAFTIAMAVSILVLYIDGWKKLIQGWGAREQSRNTIILLLLLVGTIIGAYIVYYLVPASCSKSDEKLNTTTRF